MRSVGLDLGARKISYCEVKDGQVVERTTVRSIDELSRLLGPNTVAAKVGFEACREAWHVHDVLAGWGHKPLMIDTTRTKQIGVGQHKRKTDRIDAELIAHAVEADRLPLAHLLSPERRSLRMHLGVRRTLVETRAQYVTTIRGIVRSNKERLSSCSSEDFVAKLRSTSLGEQTRELIGPLEQALVVIGEQLAVVEGKLDALCAREPVILRLSTTPGVGRVVSAVFVSVIDDAHRFSGAHQVESYLGLVPGEDSSGGRRRIGAITKHGNSYARAMLVEGAWCVLRLRDDSDPLKRWAEAIAARRGTRIAVVALARRLAGVMWAMWRDGTVYEPARLGRRMAGGLEREAQGLDVRAAALRRAASKTARRRSAVRAAQEEPSIQ
jgi:transposase